MPVLLVSKRSQCPYFLFLLISHLQSTKTIHKTMMSMICRELIQLRPKTSEFAGRIGPPRIITIIIVVVVVRGVARNLLRGWTKEEVQGQSPGGSGGRPQKPEKNANFQLRRRDMSPHAPMAMPLVVISHHENHLLFSLWDGVRIQYRVIVN